MRALVHDSSPAARLVESRAHPEAKADVHQDFENRADRAADAVVEGRRLPAEAPARRGASGPRPIGGLGTGMALDRACRGAMELGFGADFSQVRVHADDGAAVAARGFHARAFASDEHIVFGKGQYRPSESQGRRLIAHELSHVLQQRAGAPPLLRKTDPLMYDATETTLHVPTSPITLGDAQATLQAAISSGKLTAGSVSGAKAGSVEEIMLHLILATLGRRERWGTEIDLIAPVGFAPAGGGAAPVGKVTVRIDATGKGQATLLSAGAVTVPTTVTTIEAAEKQLKAFYGIKGVRNESATWTPGDLNLVLQALTRLPPDDKAALKGVVLIRVESFADPDIAGEFGPNQAVQGTTVTDEPTIRLSNKVFPPSPTNFVGGTNKLAPSGYFTILHEVAHAVASLALRNARSSEFAAIATSNQLAAINNDAVAGLKAEEGPLEALRVERNALAHAVNQANSELAAAQQSGNQAAITAATAVSDKKTKAFNAKDAEYAAAEAKFDKLVADQKSKHATSDAANAKRDALKAATVALSARPTLLARAQAAEAKAATALAAAKAGGGRTSASQEYRAAAERAGTALAGLARAVEKNPSERDAAVAAARPAAAAAVAEMKFEREALARSGDPALAIYAPVSVTQTAWLDALIRVVEVGKESARVQRFVDFVEANKILPFTRYAADEWPNNPGEFFAESYTLFLNDPEYLETNAPALLKWFQEGQYR